MTKSGSVTSLLMPVSLKKAGAIAATAAGFVYFTSPSHSCSMRLWYAAPKLSFSVAWYIIPRSKPKPTSSPFISWKTSYEEGEGSLYLRSPAIPAASISCFSVMSKYWTESPAERERLSVAFHATTGFRLKVTILA